MSYPTEVTGWRSLVKNKWVIFDSDAVISILEFKQDEVFYEMKQLNTDFIYINPVLLELMNTDRSERKLQRSKILLDNDFLELPLHQEEVRLANIIRKKLPLKCQPSPTDLYLGGTLARYPKGKCLLLTANIRDFPSPIYKREGFLLLQNDSSIKVLTFLSVDNSILDS